MAHDAAVNDSTRLDEFRRIATEYQECVGRCQQAIDRLQARDGGVDTPQNGLASVDPGPRFEIDKAVAQLSQREFEVFALISRGLTTYEISQQLSISTSTVETYRERLKTKLRIKSAPALIRQAVLWANRNP